MRLRRLGLLIAAATWFCAADGCWSAEIACLTTDFAAIGINDHGCLSTIATKAERRNYLAIGQPAPLLQVRIGGKYYLPNTGLWDAPSHRLTLRYDGPGVRVVVASESAPSYVTFAIVDVQPRKKVELVLWGPYPTIVGDIVGEVVGVARNPRVAVGIQALNTKTLGGYPDRESDICESRSFDDPGTYPNLPADLREGQEYRGNTAWPTSFGSVLQAYCRDRNRDRVIENWAVPKFLAPAVHDGGVLGSKIALFLCPAAKVLDVLETIELREGLPHPMLDGVWAKRAASANRSYMIVDFSERTIDRAAALAKQAGLNSVYHSSPFETWGHFKLKPRLFPHGIEGLKACSEKARRAGVTIGLHSLSNFTTPNDPYVTPRPDPRLARVGYSTLAADAGPTAAEIPVECPEYFQKKTTMSTAVVGEELIQYDGVSPTAPWQLLRCQRGAWGTHATAHRRGESVGKLLDHEYHVFLTNAELAQEEARNLAAVCNAANVRRISMDGLEGNWSTGCGQYGRVLFAKAWYDALSPQLRGWVFSDASNPAHFNWHINTYYNWGEPWYAGFRQSQTRYRFKNQVFFERNLLPHMLGWFALRRDTTLEDAEWLLARAAGYDAGFALVVGADSLAQQTSATTDRPRSSRSLAAILSAVRGWESARLAGAFPPDIKPQLRDNQREFHLEPAGPGQWDLFPMKSGHRGSPVRVKVSQRT